MGQMLHALATHLQSREASATEQEGVMQYAKVTSIGILGLAMITGACTREPAESRTPAAREGADRSVVTQSERDDESSRLEKRVTDIERKYAEANQKVASGERKATAGLKEELQEDVTNIKKAVSDLRTTTPENWWERHEDAMRRTADDIEADVVRVAGKAAAPSSNTPRGAGEQVDDAPFTSRRDRFVADLRARVDGMERVLDNAKASGPQETELEDVRARVKKLGEDVDRLRSASPDDWWDLSKERVTEYIARVEDSVNRLDDNKG
jgi:hypothetical protein